MKPTAVSRATFLKAVGIGALATTAAACSSPDDTTSHDGPTTHEHPTPSSGDEALAILLAGNKRFAEGRAVCTDATGRRIELSASQNPFATILSCVDSRVPPETIFDVGLGDLFVVRTAGQVLDQAVIGSVQYGVGVLGTPLILVLGHSECGAVKSTVQSVKDGKPAPADIQYLIEAITPAVKATPNGTTAPLNDVIDENARLIAARLAVSQILREAVGSGKLKIAAARYDLSTGLVQIV